jgi:hypothetical protein
MIAAECCAAARAQIQRERQLMLLGRILKRLQDDARLHGRRALLRIDVFDHPHAFEREDYFVRRGVGAVHQPGEATMRHNAQCIAWH